MGTLTGLAQTTPTAPAASPTPTPRNVVVSQQFVDDATKAFTEVVALRAALAEQAKVLPLNSAERKAVDNTIAAMDALIAVKDKISAAHVELENVLLKAISAQNDIIDRLTAQINKPKSFFDKLAATLEKIALIAAGVVIGHGL